MDLFSAIFLISAINGIVLVVILLSKKTATMSENAFLASFLAIVSGYQLREFVIMQGHFETFPHLMAVFVPLLYLLGPIFFFYIKFAIDQNAKLYLKDALHLVPAIVCFFVILPFYLKSGEEKLALYHAPHPGDFQLAPNRAIFYGLMFISALIYCLKSIRLIDDRNSIRDGRMNRSMKVKLQWLRRYTKGFIFFLMVFLLAQLIFIFLDFYQYEVMLGTIAAFSLLIHLVGYWSVKESVIVNGSDRGRNSTLTDARASEIKSGIIALLEEERIFLEHDLTSREICRRLSTNSQYLSQLINREFNCNLTHLVNSYRIDLAKEMIKDPNYDHLNLLGIATEVGFNTKNTFIRTFKRHTNQTPSEYRKSVE